MKHTFYTMAIMVALATSCASDPDVLADYMASKETNTATAAEELAQYGLAIDTTSLAETETIPADDEDYIENNEFTRTISISYDGDTAYVSGSYNDVTVDVKGADVTVTSAKKKMDYHVSGASTDGCLKIYSENKFALNLDGLTLANADGAAINIQSKKRGFIVVKTGTVNTLSDGTAYTDTVAGEDMKAAFFSEGKMLFSGTGKLQVYGNTKAALRSDKYILFRPGVNVYAKATAGNAIKSNDGLFIRGGVINAESTADDARAMTSEGVIEISGGRTTLLASGTSSNGLSDGAALKADTTLTVSGGTLLTQSLNANAIHAKQDMEVTGGTLVAYGAAQPAYAIYCDDGTLTVAGGTIKAIGGTTTAPSSASTAPTLTAYMTETASAGTALSLATADGTALTSLTCPRTLAQYALLLASPSMATGSSYTLNSGTKTLATFTLSSTGYILNNN